MNDARRPEGKTRVLEARRIDMELSRHVYVGEGKIGQNDPCPCNSKRKFKHCCISNIVRAGGATWLKPNASRETARNGK